MEDVTHDPDAAQQTVTYSLSGVDGEMTMGVQSLTASEDGLLLEMTFVPEYEGEEGPVDFEALHGAGGAMSHLLPTLNDRETFTQYFVPTSDPGKRTQGWGFGTIEAWATEVGGIEAPSGEIFSFWAHFPTPEDDIDVIDIAVVPGVQEFKDVEIDWGDVEPGSAPKGTEGSKEDG